MNGPGDDPAEEPAAGAVMHRLAEMVSDGVPWCSNVEPASGPAKVNISLIYSVYIDYIDTLLVTKP